MMGNEECKLADPDAVIAKVDFSEYEDEAALQKRYKDAVRAAIRETDRKMHTVKTA